jgi:hypothetical protein
MALMHDVGWLEVCLYAACAIGFAARADPAQDGDLRAELLRLSERRIFFGHQSVGMNLLDGVRDIAARHPDVRFRVIDVSGDAHLAPGSFGHAFMPENGNPGLKLESFERAISSGAGSAADIAFLKFCYVDFSSGTDAPGLFARYRRILNELRTRHPRTVFVHVTAPLTTVDGGAKAALKRVLGRAPAGLLENAKREEFNQLLRQTYAGKEPVFDLARLESTGPDGRRELYDWNGSKVPALLPVYTDDGGHLNPEVRVRFARELIALLASVPQAR